ncbi:MAG TPA: type II secretion system F family protein, partial [Isosphaeraceae bacterium]|nr:type II secretion system F family protein [Isosphaeraceae bacterium]
VMLVPASLFVYFVGMWILRLSSVWIGGKSLTVRFGMRHLMVFVGLAAVGFQLARVLGWSLLWLVGLALPPMVVLGVWLFFRSWGRTQQDGLIAVLGMAASRGLPLGPAVSAYAALCGGSYRAQASALAQLLESGSTLPEALDAVPGLLPRDIAALARAGWDTNQLGPALERAGVTLRARRRDAPSLRRIIVYPLFIFGCVVVGVSFLGYFIMPKMRVILADYGVAMPASALAASKVLDFLAWLFWVPLYIVIRIAAGAIQGVYQVGPFPVPILNVVLALCLIGGFLILCWWLVRLVNRALGQVVGNSTPEYLPRRRRFVRASFSRDRAAVLRSLALAVESGLPMMEVLDRLARSELSARACVAVLMVKADIRAGRPWIASLALRHLIRPVDASVLTSAERVGNLAWSLRERAEAFERRRNLRLRAFAVLLQPLAAIALGILVLLVALAYFLPLVAMISAMVDSV